MSRRFPMSFNRLMRILSIPLGAGPSRSAVTVGDDVVDVRMGWGFRARLDRAAIVRAVRHTGRIVSLGVHGFGGRWLVNGTASGVVVFELDPPQRARVLGVPIRRLRQLGVSVEDPDGLISAVRSPRR